MPNRRENVVANTDLGSVVTTRVESLNTSAAFNFTGDSYRWFYICRRCA